jgi:predicted esterase
VATVSATSAVSDVARVERAVRRVNRRVSRAVESFSVESDDGARDRAEVGGRDARRGTRDAEARGDVERALVWFHGYGDVDGESWREFCEVVVAASGKTCAVVCPDAPLANGTRAWFKPRLRTRRPDARDWTCDGIEESVERVVRVVDDACERYGIDDRAKVVVGGFSQGACLALACAKSELSDVGGVLAVRGYLPDRSREFRDLRPNTLILAGGSDPMVPREWSFEAGRLTGGDVVMRERLGHELCVEDVYRARRWITERFSGVR